MHEHNGRREDTDIYYKNSLVFFLLMYENDDRFRYIK